MYKRSSINMIVGSVEKLITDHKTTFPALKFQAPHKTTYYFIFKNNLNNLLNITSEQVFYA